MNKLVVKPKSINKFTNKPRSCIMYHYRLNKTTATRSPTPKPRASVAINKRKDISTKTRPRSVAVDRRVTKSDIKLKELVKSRRNTYKPRKTRSKFAPDVNKIHSLRGVGHGKLLAIFAPGPSILEAEIGKLQKISVVDTMTINKPDMRCWPTDYWVFCDRTQHKRNEEEFHKFPKTIINSTSIKVDHPRQIRITNLPGKGFSVDLVKGFFIGRSTTFSAMQIAGWMDYDKVFIFGCDMCRVVIEQDGKRKSLLHSYGVNPDVPEKVREKRFEREADFYDNAAKIMSERLRKKFYFCSEYNPWSFVDRFQRINQKEAVDYIFNFAKELEDG